MLWPAMDQYIHITIAVFSGMNNDERPFLSQLFWCELQV